MIQGSRLARIARRVLTPFSRSLLAASLTSSVALGGLGLAATTGVALTGCGHNEEEWQGKLKEMEALNGRLKKLETDKRQCDNELAKSQDDVTALRTENDLLKGKAGDLSKQTQEQLALIERLKKEKEQLDAIKARFDQLKRKLETLTKLGLNVTVRNNRMVIQLPGDVLFESGKVELKPKGKEMLLQVADVISKDAGLAARNYQVAGHTDNKAFSGGNYKDNWGLSVMRAREVLTFLVGPRGGKEAGGGLDDKHWAATGYADTDPVAPNDTPENMNKNRRVELVVMPNVEEMLDLSKLTK
jgi:chemotaxis protein MotB